MGRFNTNPGRLSWGSISDLGPTVAQDWSANVGQCFASIPDLGPTVAKDWWTMYRFMFVGLSFSIISDLGPALAQDWPANLSIYVDRPVFRRYF